MGKVVANGLQPIEVLRSTRLQNQVFFYTPIDYAWSYRTGCRPLSLPRSFFVRGPILEATKQRSYCCSGSRKDSFRIYFFHSDRQIYNGIFRCQSLPARTQMLVHRWNPEQGFWRYFADGINQSLDSSLRKSCQKRRGLFDLSSSRHVTLRQHWKISFLIILQLSQPG